MQESEAESLVAADSKEKVRAARGRSSERRRQWRTVAQVAAARERRIEQEREWRGTNGSGGGGRRGRVLLVADQGASRPTHVRHAAAELCRLATAARRGRLSRGRRRGRGEGGDALVGWAGFGLRARSETAAC